MVPFLYLFYRFGRGILRSLKDPEFDALLTLVVIILGIGTYFYHLNEHWSWLDSLYFSVTALTTLGSNLYPVTAAGKLFTMVYILIGIGVLLSFITYVAEHALEERKNGRSFLPWRNRNRDNA
ncbi:MAG TPA: potassium channel family protein [Candidatus Paceibacterota bacterium]|nr:potassium channel family protein [Candidatus Paceibacterota bacterium]